MWIEPVLRPERDVSRSDIATVAVGFSPRCSRFDNGRVAERRLNGWLFFNCRYATKNSIQVSRGLKPTATIIASLREATNARVSDES